MANPNSFGSKDTLSVGGTDYTVYRIDAVEGHERLPFSLKVLLENLLRTEDGANVTREQIQALGSWDADADPSVEIQFSPARVVMQDFTGVPCIVDLATMREAVVDLGGDPAKVNPLAPAELVIDHSVIVDSFGSPDSLELNMTIEYERNRERYQFLRWGQTAFSDFVVNRFLAAAEPDSNGSCSPCSHPSVLPSCPQQVHAIPIPSTNGTKPLIRRPCQSV